MSRTLRFCNKKSSPLFSHYYKFFKRKCRCSYHIDPQASRHRREKNKLEIRRELANLGVINGAEWNYPCYEWHYMLYSNAPRNNCNVEIKLISLKLSFAVK
jgi:hypothetical protein